MRNLSDIRNDHDLNVANGEIIEALDYAKELVKTHPLYMSGHIRLIQDLISLGKINEASECLYIAKKVDAEYPDLKKWEAHILAIIKFYDKESKKLNNLLVQLDKNPLNFCLVKDSIKICLNINDFNNAFAILKSSLKNSAFSHQEKEYLKILLLEVEDQIFNHDFQYSLSEPLLERLSISDLNIIYHSTSLTRKNEWQRRINILYRKQTTYFQHTQHTTDDEISKKRVFFVCSFLPYHEKTSTHLKLIGDLMSIYSNSGIEVFLLLSNLPLSGSRNKKFEIFNDENIDFLEDIYKTSLSNISQINLKMLHIKFLSFCDKKNSLLTNINKIKENIMELGITKKDIFISILGPFGCEFLISLFSRFPSTNYLLMTQSSDNIESYKNLADYFLHPLSIDKIDITRLSKVGIEKNRLLPRIIPCNPFLWEINDELKINDIEQNILNLFSTTPPSILLVSAGENFSNRCNPEFEMLIYEVLINKEFGENPIFLIIGDTKENFLSKFKKLSNIKDKIFCIEKTEVIFTLFKKISELKNVAYVYPRHPGSGRCNFYAALAGLPVILFKGNDVSMMLPDFCQRDSVQEIINFLKSIKNDESKIQIFVKDTQVFIDSYNKSSENFVLGLLNNHLHPKILL